MSLYNAVFGYNPLAAILIVRVLKIPKDYEIPRFRDCFIAPGGEEIVIHTRTGGANRIAYAEGNDRIRALPGFLRDEDDSFDSTFANWYFSIPDWAKPVVSGLYAEVPGAQTLMPADRWKQLFADIHDKKKTPDTERSEALAVDLAEQIAKGKPDKLNIIEI